MDCPEDFYFACLHYLFYCEHFQINEIRKGGIKNILHSDSTTLSFATLLHLVLSLSLFFPPCGSILKQFPDLSLFLHGKGREKEKCHVAGQH